MKNCTKLHFTRKNEDDTYEHIEDFFIGGYLLYEYNALQNVNEVKYTYNDKEYVLDSDDMVFINTKDSITEGGFTYVAILPIYDAQSLKQNLECRCSIIRGELDYNVRLGIPLKTQIDEKRLAILNIINQTPGVESSTVLSTNIVNKKLTMKVEVISNFGDFVISFS